jgi:UDP-N-acetylglucosamine 2-epimerase
MGKKTGRALARDFTAARIPCNVLGSSTLEFDMTMPEEISRKLTDAICTLLFVSEESGVHNLKDKGKSFLSATS